MKILYGVTVSGRQTGGWVKIFYNERLNYIYGPRQKEQSQTMPWDMKIKPLSICQNTMTMVKTAENVN
jgi:hypothetical protein